MTPAEKYARGKTRPVKSKPRRSRPVKWVCRVREYREKLGLTLRDVEAATGVTNGTVLAMECGYGTSLANARAVAEFFGVTVYDLWPERAKS